MLKNAVLPYDPAQYKDLPNGYSYGMCEVLVPNGRRLVPRRVGTEWTEPEEFVKDEEKLIAEHSLMNEDSRLPSQRHIWIASVLSKPDDVDGLAFWYSTREDADKYFSRGSNLRGVTFAPPICYALRTLKENP